MDYLTFLIDQKYIEKAEAELDIYDFPSWIDLREKLDSAIGQDALKSNKMLETKQWISLLERKYKELSTSLVYCLAYHYYSVDNSLYCKNPSDPFYEPHLSFFLDTAAGRAFSLIEKLGQMLNVYLELGLSEGKGMGAKQVSFKEVIKKLDISYKEKLAELEKAVEDFEELRHKHTHRFNPEHSRWKVNQSDQGKLNNEEKLVVFFGLDENKLPIVPYKQIQVYKNFQVKLYKALKNIFSKMKAEL
ncbi:hypothetical protein DNHGIG_15280 [Collibacillus ludicampi]|uniref:Cthe-2314-like HEPN domain-containing protein n=1 Tax=Collibacillus ludicampi TaxID=2771369 RepID=A0AAV4LE87_9BACL|nr:Cthe_2314 family HEPN domain-containing protein [Collibacillus ludicampi]GIM45979.1 hypothetical protein DNHGIG_15280 [Collibacillus ludicampi]